MDLKTDTNHSHHKGAHIEDKPPTAQMLRWFGILTFGLLCVMAISLFMGDLKAIHVWEPYLGGTTAPFAERQAPPVPPKPRLQVDEAADYRAYKNEEDKLLGNYVWIDQAAGKVRIPIERAMDRVLEKGLPVRGARK